MSGNGSGTPEVNTAVNSCPRPLYLLAAEFSGCPDRIKVESVKIPTAVLSRKDITLVYRIHVELLEECPVDRIAAEIKKYSALQIQLDVDCPEKKLYLYERLLGELHRLLPERKFSFTALPCHVRRPEFIKLARQADYYVLQLHSLNLPGNIGDDRRLIRREDAIPALARAEKLAAPFKVALPTYAYQLNFDRRTGRFLSLNAERMPLPTESVSSVLTTIDFNLLHDILQFNPSGQVIWFRLPVAQDMLNWDMATISDLERGKIPQPAVKVFCQQREQNRYDLVVRTTATFGFGTVKVKLCWPEKSGEFDLFGGTVNGSDNRDFGVLPELLEIPLPGCGRETRVASFFCDFTTQGNRITMMIKYGLLFGLLLGSAAPLLGCGPDFPPAYLNGDDFIQEPRIYLPGELERIARHFYPELVKAKFAKVTITKEQAILNDFSGCVS